MKIDNFVALTIVSVLTHGLCEQNSTDENSTKQELSLEHDGFIQRNDEQNLKQNSNDTSTIISTTENEEKQTLKTEINGYDITNTTNGTDTTEATPDDTDKSEYSPKSLDKNITSSTIIIDDSKTATELQEIYSKTSTFADIHKNEATLNADSKTMVEPRTQYELKTHNTSSAADENTTGTTVLLFVLVAVEILAGAAYFRYKCCENRYQTTEGKTGTEMEEIITENGGIKAIQPTTSVETKPFLKASTEPIEKN